MNFTLAELTRSDTAAKRGIDNTPDHEAIRNIMTLAEKVLQPIRDHFMKPVIVTSGFRCSHLNRVMGGAPNSQHVTGNAADIHIEGVDNDDLFMWIAKNITFDQLIAEMLEKDDGAAGWIHVSYAKTNRCQQLSFLGKGRGYHVGLEYI